MLKPTPGFAVAVSLFLVALAAPFARAADYPKGPISLVIPLAAGDATDTAARTIAQQLEHELGVPVVPLNRPGAAGALGTNVVVNAPKDGQTILLTNNAALIYRTVIDPKVATYDPFKDLTPLALAMRSPSILVAPSDRPFKNFKEMMGAAKKNSLQIGTAGVGSVGHFCVMILHRATDADLTMVPYKGAMPAVTALRGGEIDGIVLALGTMTGQLRAGAVRGMVISTKWPDFPDIPTLADLGYSEPLFDVWTGFFAPAGVPAQVVDKLVPALQHAITSPAVAARLKPLGILPEYAPPEKLVHLIRDEHQRVADLARKAGLVQ